MVPEVGYTLIDDASLEGRNTLRVPARASMLADISSAEGFEALFGFPALQLGPVLVLGEGSNTLFVGDYPGTVVSVRAHAIAIEEDDGTQALVRVEAGANWNDFVRWSLAHGFTGLENLSLIPGSVGAGPIQNIGAYGVELAEFVESVEAWDRSVGRIRTLSREACDFGYRDSAFKREPERWIVLAVRFRLRRDRALSLDYAGIREEIARMGVDTPRAVHMAEAVCRVRAAKLPDPALIGNAGSFFKNPVVPVDAAAALRAGNPGLPVFPGGATDRAKLSAAWLIERCGWKGRRIGDAGVSERHALVLVNHGRAAGADILALAQRIAADVQARFGVALEPEPRIVGARWDAPAP